MSDTPTPRTATPRCDHFIKFNHFSPTPSECMDFAACLERQLAEATAWRPIEDTPPEGVNIVLWSPYECEVGQRWGDDYSREDMKHLCPTHWQSLPNPPKP